MKSLRIVGLVTLFVMVFFSLNSFSAGSEKSCKLTVYYQNGDPADYVTVTTSSSHGQHDFKTDEKGRVTLTWEYARINYLYIKGNKYEVDFSDGESYTLTLKQNNKYS